MPTKTHTGECPACHSRVSIWDRSGKIVHHGNPPCIATGLNLKAAAKLHGTVA